MYDWLICGQGNKLTSTAGLELLAHLEALDLRFNLICSLEEVFRLGGAHAAHSVLL